MDARTGKDALEYGLMDFLELKFSVSSAASRQMARELLKCSRGNRRKLSSLVCAEVGDALILVRRAEYKVPKQVLILDPETLSVTSCGLAKQGEKAGNA